MRSIQPAHTHSSIDEGLDRKALNVITQRFMQVNQNRMARARSGLNRAQQIFLDLLPLLFHVNHPMLPGYVSHNTPRGVTHFSPTKATVQRAQRLARSFTYHRQPEMLCQIHGIYLMGSCGTIAQSGISDLDIWICHPSSLNVNELQELRIKCSRIEQWAATLALEVHFFLMDGEKFQQGHRESLSGEDCGSAQHYLLLDEFYRTGLYIAGRRPIWWSIPANEEQHYDYYADALRKKRYVRPNDTVDFGGVPDIPAGEFVGAGIWQLYKGIESPYKAVLKLLLAVVYASEYPEAENLSSLFKQAIYSNHLDIDELDPYVMIYRKLERYLLKRNESKRLELIRRCFYFKVGKKLSRPPQHLHASWQRVLMQKLVSEWEWTPRLLKDLDNADNWSTPRVMAERKELVKELTNSYRFLSDFARRNQAAVLINSREMNILGRKLYAAFERKAGKIELINPGITKNPGEEALSFCLVKYHKQTAWAVFTEKEAINEPTRYQPIKRCKSLVQLVSWCHFNEILDNATRIDFNKEGHSLQHFEFDNIIRSLQNLMPANANRHASNQVYEKKAFPIHIVMYVNVAIDPLQKMKDRGLHRLSSHTNALGYSGLRENLVLSIDTITLNSWHEITCQTYQGADALIHCIKDYMKSNSLDLEHPLPKLDVRCYCPSRAPAIAQRVEELFRDISDCYYARPGSHNRRYVLEIEKSYFVIQPRDNKVNVTRTSDHKMLISQLSKSQLEHSRIVLDRYTLPNSILASITAHAKPQAVCVYFQNQSNGQASVYIVDERGSLFSFTTPFHDQQALLTPLKTFLTYTRYRQNNALIGPSVDLDPINLQEEVNWDMFFFEVTQTSANTLPRIAPCRVKDELTNPHYFDIQAIAERNDDNEIVFNIFCDELEFSSLEWGDELFEAVAKFILGRRRSKERYPCHLTDLDLAVAIDQQESIIQTADYLRYRQMLEQGLNNALQNI